MLHLLSGPLLGAGREPEHLVGGQALVPGRIELRQGYLLLLRLGGSSLPEGGEVLGSGSSGTGRIALLLLGGPGPDIDPGFGHLQVGRHLTAEKQEQYRREVRKTLGRATMMMRS